MSDTRRSQLLNFVERELIGPDPVDWEGTLQDNGEEILIADPPATRYIAGVLYPQQSSDDNIEIAASEKGVFEEDGSDDFVPVDENSGELVDNFELLEESEELINRSNAYRQSAMSITMAIQDGDRLLAHVSAGTYRTTKQINPATGKESVVYPRTGIEWTSPEGVIEVPSSEKGMVKIPIGATGLQLDITFRYRIQGGSICTVTLENAKKTDLKVRDDDCFYQVKFDVESSLGFMPLPDSQRIYTSDLDYQTNQLLYRNVRNFAIGHGCAADWDEVEGTVRCISSAIFPSYEMKPIVPSAIPGVSLDMLLMSPQGSTSEAIAELQSLCDEYQKWINHLKAQVCDLEKRYVETAQRHIENCEQCLVRMRSGVDLLKTDKTVLTAFQYMNLAMLMQQLHYNLPKQKWETDGNGGLRLIDPIVQLPDVSDRSTWYKSDEKTYGKWRPFQIAFILMNLMSMYDRKSSERGIVDLIWFPTGGGKTEAYLGLSAYTIFIRRLLNRSDNGTAILMRYTLRLLTAQQYERASSLICACELIREHNAKLFGDSRISIGLWVGVSTTPNRMKEAVDKYRKLYEKPTGENPFVLLKCPWCGAEMGPVQSGEVRRALPGYEKDRLKNRKEKIFFRCSNKEHHCAFSESSRPLPLHIIDEDIYEVRPTLLLGTVDKFAMLPFRPEAQGIFGFDSNGRKRTSPDLIIQDELHLISGPLGSMVGHYETLIGELCTTREGTETIRPKIIASTATISRAKEQCHALYAVPPDDVFQFPPPGINAEDSFFAVEDRESDGRQYVGILASASSSDMTTAIRLYASLLYGAKALDVDDEADRDPYWTNVGYYNSIRELGQAATWIRADIDQHLDVIYKRHFDDKRYSTIEEYRRSRRYIWRDEELTSRIQSDKVTASLGNLGISYPERLGPDGKVAEHAIDICLATNMISVGLDVSRLGLMTVSGQPKTTSEYIQATSRVGRDTRNAPGIVFVLYKPGRPRDKSHYEHFRDYHSRVYCNVEPTSVTPFSAPVRERALHAILVGILRLEGDSVFNDDPPVVPDENVLKRVREIICERARSVNDESVQGILDRLEYIMNCWEDWGPARWEPGRNFDRSYKDDVPLLYPAGTHRNEAWGERGIETPTSMRSVDASCEASVLSNRYSVCED